MSIVMRGKENGGKGQIKVLVGWAKYVQVK